MDFTEEELIQIEKKKLRKNFLHQILAYKNYWKNLPDKTVEERLDGLVFSMLVVCDGEAIFHPPVDLKINDIIINDDCSLHELWYQIQQ